MNRHLRLDILRIDAERETCGDCHHPIKEINP